MKKEFVHRKMKSLPQELITEILSLLPIKPLVRFQCVSKPWFSQINNSDFIKLHLKLNHSRERTLIVKETEFPHDYYKVNFSNEGRFGEAVKIKKPLPSEECTLVVGCCNGLVCIRDLNCDGEIVIWNPLIGKYKKLPSKRLIDTFYDRFSYDFLAFEYDPVNDDYKVFKFVTRVTRRAWDEEEGVYSRKERVYSRELYSLREHSWRMVKEKWPLKESYIYSDWPAFLNGTFHWWVGRTNFKKVIVTFNLSTEKFQVPNFDFFFFMKPCVNILVLRGWLCLIVGEEVKEVWVMKEYGVANSWTLLYTVQLDSAFYICRPLLFSHDGGEEVLTREKEIIERDLHQLFWYDIKNKTHRIVEIQNMPSGLYMSYTCVGSLLLLDADHDN
ncbi:F-box protein CPR1-like [Corylus avellana]|uniref:F-box protein CPR1-like n=1 Tax=Corylus avellana TaxID=13451 RepID=UPI00286D0715|nr:F-box protein CPR1-like [Corylus avellana]